GHFAVPPAVFDVAEAVAADDDAGMQHHPAADADPVQHDDARVQHRVVADDHVPPHVHAGVDADVAADSRARADDRVGPHRAAVADDGVRGDAGGDVDVPGRLGEGGELLQNDGEGKTGGVHADDRDRKRAVVE